MIVPYSVDVPMERWPVANWCIMGVTCAASFLAFPAMSGVAPIESWMLYGAAPWDAEVGVLGSVMTHADMWHLIGNMVFLFVFGNAVNAKVGHSMYIALYFTFGAVASIASAVFSDVPGLGASGAIAGITGMFIVFFPKKTVSVFYWFYRAVGTWSVPAIVVIGLYFAKDVLYHVLEQTTSFASGVGVIAHISGTLAGFAAGVALVLTDRVRATTSEETLLEVVGLQ
ncbi:MAG: rhomboid family intramembrane serine protease [Planctomycetota bacterium]